MSTSTSNTQVTRVHAGNKSNTQVCLPLSTGILYGIPVALIPAVLVYLLTITIIMCFASQFAISEKATPQQVRLL